MQIVLLYHADFIVRIALTRFPSYVIVNRTVLTVEPGVWRWNFSFVFPSKFWYGRQDDLSIGHRAEEYQFNSWNWSHSRCRNWSQKKRELGLSVFTMESGLELHVFLHWFFLFIPVFPATFSPSKLSYTLLSLCPMPKTPKKKEIKMPPIPSAFFFGD